MTRAASPAGTVPDVPDEPPLDEPLPESSSPDELLGFLVGAPASGSTPDDVEPPHATTAATREKETKETDRTEPTPSRDMAPLWHIVRPPANGGQTE